MYKCAFANLNETSTVSHACGYLLMLKVRDELVGYSHRKTPPFIRI